MVELLKSPADLVLSNLSSFRLSLRETRNIAPFLDLNGVALLAKAAVSSKLKKEKQIQIELLGILAFLISCEDVVHPSLFDPAPLAELAVKSAASNSQELRCDLFVNSSEEYFFSSSVHSVLTAALTNYSAQLKRKNERCARQLNTVKYFDFALSSEITSNGTATESSKESFKEAERRSRHSSGKEAASVSPRTENPTKLRMQVKLLMETLGSIQGLQDDLTTQYTSFKQGFEVKEAELRVAASRVSSLEKVIYFTRMVIFIEFFKRICMICVPSTQKRRSDFGRT